MPWRRCTRCGIGFFQSTFPDARRLIIARVLSTTDEQAVDLAPGNAEIVEEVERIRQLQEELHIHRSTMRAVGHVTEDGATPQASANDDDDDPAAQEVARCLYNLSSRARAVDNDAAIAGGSAEVDMHLQG